MLARLVMAFGILAMAVAGEARTRARVTTDRDGLPDYSLNLSLDSRDLSRVAYCKDLRQVADWNCSLCAQVSGGLLSNVTTFYDGRVEMQGFVGMRPKSATQRPQVVAVFRGSEDLENYIKDLEIAKASDYHHCSGCKVHTSFLESMFRLSFLLRLTHSLPQISA
jgi:hypothetical protein